MAGWSGAGRGGGSDGSDGFHLTHVLSCGFRPESNDCGAHRGPLGERHVRVRVGKASCSFSFVEMPLPSGVTWHRPSFWVPELVNFKGRTSQPFWAETVAQRQSDAGEQWGLGAESQAPVPRAGREGDGETGHLPARPQLILTSRPFSVLCHGEF